MMWNEILENLQLQLSEKEFDVVKSHTLHLGVFSEPYLSYMLDGKKTIESRFSKNKILPFEANYKGRPRSR